MSVRVRMQAERQYHLEIVLPTGQTGDICPMRQNYPPGESNQLFGQRHRTRTINSSLPNVLATQNQLAIPTGTTGSRNEHLFRTPL